MLWIDLKNSLDPSMLRRFGFAGTLFFPVLTALIFLIKGSLNCLTLALVPAFFLPALVYPPVLAPVYRIMTRVSRMIGTVISTLFLSLFHLIVFTSIRIIFRLRSKDFLKQGPEQNRVTYWIDADPEDRDNMEKQY